MNYKNGEGIIFVGGSPRSGTTLIKRLLDGHNDIYCGPEFGHLPKLMDTYHEMGKGIKSDRISSYSTLAELDTSTKNFILEFLLKPLKESNKNIIAEKTPGNIKAFPHLHQLFPESKLLHVLRNPFDVVASFLKVGQRKENLAEHFYDARKAAIQWRQTVNWVNRYEISKTANFQNNYKVVKYEELVINSEDIMKDICLWAQIEYDPGMLSLKKSSADPKKFGNVFYTESEYHRPIEIKSDKAYRDILTKEDELAILEETKLELIKFNYMTKQEIEERRNELTSSFKTKLLFWR